MELIKECELKEVEERKKRDAAIRANFAKHRAVNVEKCAKH